MDHRIISRLVVILLLLPMLSAGAKLTTPKPTFSSATAVSTLSTAKFSRSNEKSISTITAFPIEDNTTPKIRQCSCGEVYECQQTAYDNVTDCFDECHHALHVLGKNTEQYIDCFEKNVNGLTQAEICLKGKIGEFCNEKNETRFINVPNYDSFHGFEYRNTSKATIYGSLHKKTHKTFHVFQKFYHCAKHCVHRRMIKCFKSTGCAVQLPAKESFVDMMESCAKTHKGATTNLMSTCRCLLFQKKVQSLMGQCGIMGVPFYVKKF